MITSHKYHDDIQGILQTALAGVTTYTPRQYRSTGIVMPHIARDDVFSMVFQMPHRKSLGTPIDSVHLHFIPIAAAAGDIQISYAWGWYNHNDEIPASLPNTNTITITLASADQYKQKINTIITNLSAPTNEVYSSILYVKLIRLSAGDTWGTGEIALAYMDAHFLSDRFGSYNETTD
jgi:hypothetical protein